MDSYMSGLDLRSPSSLREFRVSLEEALESTDSHVISWSRSSVAIEAGEEKVLA